MALSEGEKSNLDENAILKGIALIIACMAILGLADNMLRFVSVEIGLWQFHAVRGAFVALVVLIGAKIAGWPVRPKKPVAVILRTVFQSASMVFYFAAIGSIPVAKAVAGLFTAPIFMLIFSVLFFKHSIGIYRILAVAIGFSGVLVILKPFDGAMDPMLIASVAGGVFYAMGLLTTREYCADEPTSILVIGFFAMLSIFGFIGIVVNTWIFPVAGEAGFLTQGWVWPSIPVWGILAAIALMAMAAMSLQTKAFQIADPSRLAVFEFSFLVFAGFWGWVLWAETYSFTDVIGACLIVLAGIVISLRS